MADILLTKNHVVHSIEDEQGNRDINYFQNTTQDVLIDEDADEDIRGHITYYGSCLTADNDAAKHIDVIDGKADVLRKGVQLNVTFPNGNTVAPVTLSVNDSPDYSVEGIVETSITANQTLILIFTGNSFILGGSGGTAVGKEEVVGNTTDTPVRYPSFVSGESGNADFKIDEKFKITDNGLETEIGHSTVDFAVDNPELTKDVRATHTPNPKEAIRVIITKVRHVIDALGKLAFKDSVGTSELNQQLKDHYNLTVHKSGSINGSAVNDLYNGVDYNGTVGVKSLDAKVGKTLQDQITSLNSKITNFDGSKSRIVASALGQARGMATTWTWEQVISNIEGIVNRGNVSKTFTPSNSEQSYTVQQGYHGGSGVVKCAAVALSGDAGTGNVIKGKTFYTTSLTKQTGTMPKYNTNVGTSVTTGWGIEGRGAFWIYVPNAGYYEQNHWLEVPFNTYVKKVYNSIYRRINFGVYFDASNAGVKTVNVSITTNSLKSSGSKCPWYNGSWHISKPNNPVAEEQNAGNYYWLTLNFTGNTGAWSQLNQFSKHELFGGAWKLTNSSGYADNDYWIMNPNGKCMSTHVDLEISQWAMTPKDGYYYKPSAGKNYTWYDCPYIYLPVRYGNANYSGYFYIILTGTDNYQETLNK